MKSSIEAREFLTYLAGSYIVAAVLNVGIGLGVNAAWKTVLGGTMVTGLILFAVVLVDREKKRTTKMSIEKAEDGLENENQNSSSVAAEFPRPALGGSVLVQNYPLRGIKAEYFTGPTSSDDFGGRTMPLLLRRVADWMDSVDLQDPEYESVETRTTFIEETPDSFYQTVTVYYRENVDTKRNEPERDAETVQD